LHRSSEGGYSIAQFQLGHLYQQKQLWQDAVKWLELSAQKNYAPAKSLLAEVKLAADKIAEEKANSDNTEVLESNDTDLETLQIQSESVPPLLSVNPNEPVLNLIPTNEEKIARSLADNTKVMSNVEKLVISAKQGNPIAQHNLSTLFSIGALVPKDNRKAFMLMQEAAKQGLTQSQNSLAMMYINGVGVEPNYQSAYFWASTSTRQGDQEGKQILSYLVSIAQ
jgi:TPR repeat protein